MAPFFITLPSPKHLFLHLALLLLLLPTNQSSIHNYSAPTMEPNSGIFNQVQQRVVTVNGINMQVAEMGQARKGTILFLHGFPELWYSWRYQLTSFSSAGYRAIAPDLRGYGGTFAPPSISDYTAFDIVGDLVALLDLLELDQVYLVGHDWGALIAWYFSLFRPNRIKALVNLSVAYMPRNPIIKPVEMFRKAFGDDFYICRFQKPGEIEEEFAEINTGQLLKVFFTIRDPRPLIIPKGALKKAAEKHIDLPSWISEGDIKYYAETFNKTGFTGGFNYYRNMDRNWELMAPWTGAKIKVPVTFMVGDLDMAYNFPGVKDYIHKGGFKKDVPLLEDVIVMKGVAHFINQEAKDEVNKHIRQFFDKY